MPIKAKSTCSLLFSKRAPLSATAAAPYVGADQEMDPKEAISVKTASAKSIAPHA